MYILEVQRIYIDGHILHPEWNGKSEHIGYMNKIFKTKQKACAPFLFTLIYKFSSL